MPGGAVRIYNSAKPPALTGVLSTSSVVRCFGLNLANADGSLPANYECASLGWNSGSSNYELVAQAGGSGVVRTISFPLGASFGSHAAINLANPVNPQDAATKAYVDATVDGLQIQPTATVATTTALPANTYNNGTSGVGATLTGNVTGTLTIDGHLVVLNDLVLVKNEAASANNGEYTCTVAGASGVAYILTRCTGMDIAADFSGAFIPVGNVGTTNANSLWLANPSGTVTVGTTAIPFTQLNSPVTLTQGVGINISGNVVSVVNGVYTTGSYANPTWLSSISSSIISGQTSVANGGTGLSALTAHSIVVGAGTSAASLVPVGTAGRIFIDKGASADPAFVVVSGDATITSSGAVTVQGLQGVTVVNTSPAAGQVLTYGGSSWAPANLPVATVALGGTGQSTKAGAFNALSPLSAPGDLLYGGSLGAGTRLAGNTSTTTCLLMQTGDGSNSSAPVWSTLASVLAGGVITTHLVGTGTTPTITAGAGAGSSAFVSLSGTDMAGKITLTSGLLPSVSSVVLTVTFNTAYIAAPHVVLSPANSNAAALSGLAMIYVTATTTTFVFTGGATALTASTQYVWEYQVVG